VKPDGTALLYAGYIGGTGRDVGSGIAVDATGAAYITGSTNSTDLPVMVGPGLTYNGGGNDAFVAKVKPAGSALDYADGDDGDAVDPTGAAYVTGYTDSGEATSRWRCPDRTHNGGSDAFVAKVSAVVTDSPDCCWPCCPRCRLGTLTHRRTHDEDKSHNT
jgi:hypothetical protein